MRRWSVLTECVLDDIRTSAKLRIGASVDTAIVEPLAACSGAAAITGRLAAVPSALSR